GDPEACADLGARFTDARRAADVRAFGVERLRSACPASAAACVTLAERHEEGLSVSRDLREAARYHDEACARGVVTSCGRVGDLYSAGSGVPRDRARAAAAYGLVCDAGDASGCRSRAEQWLLAGLEGAPEGPARGIGAYDVLCGAGDAVACGRLGELH